MGNDITLQNFIPEVNRLLATYYPNAETIHYGDPACMQVNDKSEYTSYQILLQHKIQMGIKQSTYRERKEIIENKLGTMINGKPSIMVDGRYCRTCEEGFLGGYHYPERKPEQQNSPVFEQPYKDGFYEHVINAAEYIAVNMFSAVRQGMRPKNGPSQRQVESRDNI